MISRSSLSRTVAVLVLIGALIGTVKSCGNQRVANELAAQDSLRQIYQAQKMYQSSSGSYAESLSLLVEQGLLNKNIAKGHHGYSFMIVEATMLTLEQSKDNPGPEWIFSALAVPTRTWGFWKSGSRRFAIMQDGKLRADKEIHRTVKKGDLSLHQMPIIVE